MNPKALEAAYGLFVETGYDGDLNKFINLINTNPEALKAAHNLFVQTGYDGDLDKFSVLVGVKKKEAGLPVQSQAQGQPTQGQAQPQGGQQGATASSLGTSSSESSTQPSTPKPLPPAPSNEELIRMYGSTVKPMTAEQIRNEERFGYMGRSPMSDEIVASGAAEVYAKQEALKQEEKERKIRVAEQQKAEEIYNESRRLQEQTPVSNAQFISDQLAQKYNIPVEEVDAYIQQGAPYKEEEYFSPDSFMGKTLSWMRGPNISGYSLEYIADVIDDFGRAISQGSTQAESVTPSVDVMANLGKMEPEKIKAFAQAGKQMNDMPPSQEMVEFQRTVDKEGGGVWGLIKGLAQNPSVGPTILASSLAAMANKASLAAAGTVVGGAAIGGAAAGGVTAIGTAVASLPYAMAAASTMLESGLTFQELFSEEMVKRGFVNDKGAADWDNEEAIKNILEDEDTMGLLRARALGRGVTIGSIDAIAGRIGTKIAAKPALSSMARVGRAAKTAGVEMVGGSAGEAAGRFVAGQKMDVVEIGLEGLAEAPMTVVDIAAASVERPKFTINGEKINEKEFNSILKNVEEGRLSADEFLKMDVTIDNDKFGYSDRVKNIFQTNEIKKKVMQAFPDLDEASVSKVVELEKELVKLKDNDTQVAKDKRAQITKQINEIQGAAAAAPAAAPVAAPAAAPVAAPAAKEKPTGIPEEISSLNDDEQVTFTVKTLDEVPEEFRDRAEKLEGVNVEVRKSILGIPIGPKTTKVINDGFRYVLTGKEAKDYAIQKQSAEGGVLRAEQPQVGLQEVGEGDKAKEFTQKSIADAEQAKQVELPKIETVEQNEAGISTGEKPEKILFLDVNGVINAGASRSGDVLPQLMAYVNRIIEETGAKVVISSDERMGDLNATREKMKQYGFKHADKIIGETSVDKEGDQEFRGDRIENWKNTFAPDATIVALDDNDSGFKDNQKSSLVSPSRFLGMNEDLANKAIAKLNKVAGSEAEAIAQNIFPSEEEMVVLDEMESSVKEAGKAAAPKAAPTAAPTAKGVSMKDTAAADELTARTPDTTKAKIIRQAMKAVKTVQSMFPDFDVVLHEDEATFDQAMVEGKNPSLRGSGGALTRVRTADGKTTVKIHINLNKASINTVPHEVAHAVMLKAFGDDPKLFKVFRDRISKVLSADRNKQLRDFADQYEESESYEEFLVELAAVLVTNKDTLNKVTVSKILEIINKVVSKITGGAFVPFKSISEATATNDLVDFFNSMSKSIAAGEAVEVTEKGKVKIAEGVVSKGRKSEMPMSIYNLDSLQSGIKSFVGGSKKISNSSVAKYLEDVATKHFGSIVTSSDITPEQEEQITKNGTEEVIKEIETNDKNAADWYSKAIDVAVAVAGLIHPELSSVDSASKVGVFSKEKDPVAAAQMALRMALAITSQNLDVDANTNYAEEQFEIFKKTGKFDPEKKYGSKASSISSNLKLANLLIEKVGLNEAERMIRNEYSITELEDVFKKATGKSVKITGYRNDTVNGSAVFGPKIGQGFLQNLIGNFNPVTIDLWMRRTWGRWTGDVVGTGVTEDRMAKLIKYVKEGLKKKEFTIELPKEFSEYKPVERKRDGKNGKSYLTMDDSFTERIENDIDFVEVLQNLSKEIAKIANDYYKAIHDIPMTKELYDKFISGELSYSKVAIKLKSIKEKLGEKYEDYKSKERAAKRKPMLKDGWLKSQYKKMGMTINPSNKEISDRKPKWGNAATVIKNDLNPIDIPSNLDRKVITRIVNNIRKQLAERGYIVTNADVQALLWYPEKDIWAKLKGEEQSSKKLSYDNQFIEIAESRGLGEQANRIAEQIRSGGSVSTSGVNERGGDVKVSRPSPEEGEIVTKGRKAEKVSKLESILSAYELSVSGGYSKEEQSRMSANERRSASIRASNAKKKLDTMLGFDFGDFPSQTDKQKEIRNAVSYLNRLVGDGRFAKYNDVKELSDAYEKAKEDNSNPELVKSVEAIIGEPEIVTKGRKQVEAYHGSPYDFERFTTEKIGTGEGVQAFGWGLYFTDVKSIAEHYKKALSGDVLSLDGKDYKLDKDGSNDDLRNDYPDIYYVRGLLGKSENVESAKKAILDYLSSNKQNLGNSFYETANRAIKSLESLGSFESKKSGKLYQVSLHQGKTPDQYTWLEWDKLISDNVFNKIKNAIQNKYGNKLEDYDGKPILTFIDIPSMRGGAIMYKTLSRALGGDKKASLFLLDAGIDGVKYPAESISRGATSETARGSNYVVFDEKAVTIVTKGRKAEKPSDKGEKRIPSPSVKKILGIKDTKKVTMSEKEALKKRLTDEARGARNAASAIKKAYVAIAEELKEMVKSGKISLRQMTVIMNRFAKLKVLDEASVSNFVDYMANVMENAEYLEKISAIKGLIPNAKKNILKKIGMANSIRPKLQILLSIKPTFIPSDVFEKYNEIVGMFGSNAKVLSLKEVEKVSSMIDDIINSVNSKNSLINELSDKFANTDSKVYDKEGKLDYAATVAKMQENGEIWVGDVETMMKNRAKIYPSNKKDIKPSTIDTLVKKMNRKGVPMDKAITKVANQLGMDRDEVLAALDEAENKRNELIGVIYSMSAGIDESIFESRDERSDVANLKKLLAESDAIEDMSLNDLENIVKMIDNIQNGYLSNFAKVISEKIQKNKDADVITLAVSEANVPIISKAIAKAKAAIGLGKDKSYVNQAVKRSILFYIDQVLGNFKNQRVMKALFGKSAQALSKFEYQYNVVSKILEKAQERVAISLGSDHNEMVKSNFKMMAYMLQQEFESNPNSNVVPAIEHLNETISFWKDNPSKYSARDVEFLQEVIERYSVDGQISLELLDASFNNEQREAIDTMMAVGNGSDRKEFGNLPDLRSMAEYTAAVIHGEALKPLNNYIHHSVMSKDDTQGKALSEVNNLMKPGTNSKTLISRTGAATPMHMDPFASVQKGAKSILIDYHLTSPVRTARMALSESMARLNMDENMSESEKKERKMVLEAIDNAYETALADILTQSMEETSFADDVSKIIAKNGYRAVLAGLGRTAAELISNMSYALFVNPVSTAVGIKRYRKLIMSDDAPAVMNAVGSTVTNRAYPADSLMGGFVDPNVINSVSGMKSSSSYNGILNAANKIYNKTAKKYVSIVAGVADTLITSSDKIISRPIWFGSFDEKFKEITGQNPDMKLLAKSDEAYMAKYKDALDIAREYADAELMRAATSNNTFMASIKGKGKNKNKALLLKWYTMFNNYMTNFAMWEYRTSLTGLTSLMGEGLVNKKKGAAILAGTTARIMVYTIVGTYIAKAIEGMFSDDDDEDESQSDNSFKQELGQAFASSMVSTVLGRDFGQLGRALIAEGTEYVNEKYLNSLRNGEYDPYEDAISYRMGAEGVSELTVEDIAKRSLGPYGPFVKVLSKAGELAVKGKRLEKEEEEAKSEEANKRVMLWDEDEAAERAKKRMEREQSLDREYVRLGVTALGAMGLVPFNKDVEKFVNAWTYKSFKQSEKAREKEKAEKDRRQELKDRLLYDEANNKRYDSFGDMKKYNERLWKSRYPKWNEVVKDENLERAKENLEEQKQKDKYYEAELTERQRKARIKKELIISKGFASEEEMKELAPELYYRLFPKEQSIKVGGKYNFRKSSGGPKVGGKANFRKKD